MILSAFLLGGCFGGADGNSVMHKPADTPDLETKSKTDTDESKTIIYEGDETLLKLGLSITEGGIPTNRDAIYKRFAEYKSMGITCVRIDTRWNSAVKGIWDISAETETMLLAAREFGLTMKLILPTIMAPPAWLAADSSSRLEDYNGRLSVNTVSYWYDGIYDYTDSALRAQLAALKHGGWSDVIGAIIVDMGPAGEGLYPPAWTQAANGLDSQFSAEDVMWCYADNAQTDFRTHMKNKYGDIQTAGKAWGADYPSFDMLTVPKPGEARGTLWLDTLEWYRDVKREFMSKQVDIFKTAIADFGFDDKYLVIYLPGADYTKAQWETCVANGDAISQIKIGGDNNFIVRLASEKDCLLQYTGINDEHSLRLLRMYMYENGYGSIPVFGENAGDPISAGDPVRLAEIIKEQKLWGIDYTHSRMLYSSNGISHSALFDVLKPLIPEIAKYLRSVDISVLPEFFISQSAAPEGEVLRFDISFSKPENEKLAFVFMKIASINFQIKKGDTLEYDIKMSDRMQGLGAVDGIFSDGKTMRDNFGLRDKTGLSVHPNTDLRDYAFTDWYHRVIELGNSLSDSAILKEIMIAAHPESKDGAFTDETVTVFYDNIVIKRGGETVLEIFRGSGDVKPSERATSKKYASGKITVVLLD